MTTRITLISSGATGEIQNATFGGDASLASEEKARAAALIAILPDCNRVLRAPDQLSRQTAEALSLSAACEPAWREIDFGSWSGKDLRDVQEETPGALAAWLGDPSCPPPGGESIAHFVKRIGDWLDRQRESQEKLTIVAPANCLRAAMLHCLRAQPDAFRAIDIMPLTIIQISAYRQLWRLRIGRQAERG